jgi:2-polyprenyl-6-methoxyphenol hydroxylase-like FAD-dependent oxidoreductase
VVVGADGIFSAVRRQKLNDAAGLTYLGLLIILGIVHGDSHALTDRQIFQVSAHSTLHSALRPLHPASAHQSVC